MLLVEGRSSPGDTRALARLSPPPGEMRPCSGRLLFWVLPAAALRRPSVRHSGETPGTLFMRPFSLWQASQASAFDFGATMCVIGHML
jgi:hypothetical protein